MEIKKGNLEGGKKMGRFGPANKVCLIKCLGHRYHLLLMPCFTFQQEPVAQAQFRIPPPPYVEVLDSLISCSNPLERTPTVSFDGWENDSVDVQAESLSCWPTRRARRSQKRRRTLEGSTSLCCLPGLF